MIKKKALAASLIALLSLTSSAAAAPLTRGDYNNDGLSDLTVALRRSNTQTEWAVRLTGSGDIQSHVFTGARGDALAPARYQANQGSLPAIVTVRSASAPLEWQVRLANNTTAVVNFGLPGDRVLNPIDFDLDQIDDFLVVRNGPGNALTWYVALSGYGGSIVSTVFGQSGDAVFTYYDEGLPRIGAVRIGPGNVLNWFSKSLFGNDVDQKLWGVSTDIPLIPHDMDGNDRADLIVARPETANGLDQQTLFVATQDTAQVYTVGRATSIPFIGNFSGGSANQVGWVQRDGAGANSLIGIRDGNGNVDVRTFGINENIIVRPDYSVVERSSNGTLNGGGGSDPGSPPGDPQTCQSTVGSGWLWKPASQDSGGSREGKPLILFSRYSYGSSCLKVLAANGVQVSELGNFSSNRFYEGYGCGDGNSGSSLKAKAEAANNGNATIFVLGTDGRCFGPIPNPAARKDVR